MSKSSSESGGRPISIVLWKFNRGDTPQLGGGMPGGDSVSDAGRTGRLDWARDLVLPTILFAALGAMNWAVRGQKGFGGGAGCIFAGVLWGTAWWYCARDPRREQSRRYASGWIVFAITFGMAIAGERGWRQWSHFFNGQLFTHFREQEFVPIPTWYGFLWLFVAGAPWAGLSACFLAWCGSKRETRACLWMLRIACGYLAGTLGGVLIGKYPQYFLPLYTSIEDRYRNLGDNPDLLRIINDCTGAVTHMGYYLGFLLFEILRRDWKNVVLILTVGVINGIGWALLQNWMWAPAVFQDANFAWWRCWESSGGISIGIAYGIAYFLVNRPMSEDERLVIASRRSMAGPNYEWLVTFGGLAAVLSVFVAGLVGWRRSVGWGEFELPPRLGEILREHFDLWGSIYFALVMLFALAYYFRYRASAINETPEQRKSFAMIRNVEVGALVVVIAMIAPLFAGRELLQKAGARLADAAPFLAENLRGLGGFVSVRMICALAAWGCGLGWYFVRRRKLDEERLATTPSDGDPNLERLGVYLGVLAGISLSLVNGWTGWFRIYRNENWNDALWHLFGPCFLPVLMAILAWILFRPLPRNQRGDIFPRAYGIVWLVLIAQNAIAQLVTGPFAVWNEAAFTFYYAILFVITAVIFVHMRARKVRGA